MGKLTNAMLLIIAVQIGLMFYLGIGFSGSSLYNFIMGPEGWARMDLIDWVTVLLTSTAGVLVVIGLLWYRTEFPFYLAIAGVLFTFAQVYWEAYQRVLAILIPWGIPQEIIALIFVPMLLPWIIIILDYARRSD